MQKSTFAIDMNLGATLEPIFIEIMEDTGRATFPTGFNDFIQLLVNSGHKFVYIKSIILQGLTKVCVYGIKG